MADDLYSASRFSEAFQYNPFDAPPDNQGGQASRIRAYCKVIVAGVDITNNLDPHLLSVRIIDGKDYRAEIEIDDRDGHLPIPPIGSEVQIELGWAAESLIRVFDGKIQDLEYGANRQEGRKMWVHAFGPDWRSDIKTPMHGHWGEGAPPGAEMGLPIPFMQAASDVASQAGGSAAINPMFASIMRDYWHQSNESAAHWYQRHAGDLGGQHRIESGNTFVLTVPGQNADGSTKTTVTAEWGKNLIGCRVRPMSARSIWDSAQQSWYSTVAGAWNQSKSQFNLGAPWNAAAQYQLPVPAAHSEQATQQTQGAGEQGYLGEGRIVMNGEPAAEWGGLVLLQGVRPGVNGMYFIDQAEHVYSRQGYITWLDVSPAWEASADDNIGSAYQPKNTQAGTATTP